MQKRKTKSTKLQIIGERDITQHTNPPILQASNDNIYVTSTLTTKINLSIKDMGNNLKEILEYKLKQKVSGKCNQSGYIRPNSIEIIKYSTGVITMSEFIEYNIVYKCQVCFPVEGMIVSVYVKYITKAGIHCTLLREAIDGTEDATNQSENNPLVVFIIKEHNTENENIERIAVNDKIQVKIIGIRFELNDTFISAIGTLVPALSNVRGGGGGDAAAGDDDKEENEE